MSSSNSRSASPATKIKHGEGTIFFFSEIFGNLSPQTKRTLDRERLVTKLRKNQHLFRLRDKVDRIYILLEGYAILERESDDHGVKSMLILRPGDLTNEVILESPSASSSLRALTDITVVSYSRTIFWELMQKDPALTRYVLNSMAIKIRRLYRTLESSTKVTKLDHQVASRLWKLAKDFGERKTIEESEESEGSEESKESESTGEQSTNGGPTSRSDYIEILFDVRITFLASFVGSNRETVSRIIKRMSDAGILSIENGRCRIYDLDKLNQFRKDTAK